MEVINSIAQTWWHWMGAMLWQVSLVILIIGSIDFLIKSWVWPQVRYALWLLVLLKLVLPPTWTLPTSIVSQLRPKVEQQIVQQWLQPKLPSVPETQSKEFTAIPPSKTETRSTAMPLSGRSSNALSWQSAALLVWLAGMLVFFAVLSLQMMRLRRWHDQQKSREIPPWFHELLVETSQKIGSQHLPAIVFHEKAKTPAVYGLLRPVMLLPANYFDKLSGAEARHVILHELAHLKRGDLWLHGLSLLLQIIYWFNPLMIWARQQLKHVREICCDLTVAGILREKTREYRQILLNTARGLLTERVQPGLGLMGVFEEPFRLVTRLKWLEKETWKNRWLALAASVATFIIVAVLILPMDPVGSAESIFNASPLFQMQQQSSPSGSVKNTKNAAGSQGDCYFIKEISWSDEYNWWSKQSSTFQEPGKFYLCAQRASLTQDNLTCILDRDANSFTLISHRTHSYVVMSLPLDIPNIYSDELRWLFKNRTTTGEVKRGRQREVINGRMSQVYQVTYWPIIDGKKRQKSETRVWASTEVPFDLGLHEQVLYNMRQIYNRDADLQRQLLTIKGAQTRVIISRKRFPRETRYCSEIMEILNQSPPEEAFAIPKGYEEKKHIEPKDLGFE